MKKISIIIPCYNCCDFLDETIECLKTQTYKDFEVICINDGSKDNTLNKLYELQASSGLDISVFTQENSGVSKTRNRGIEVAEGEYVLFLDADDIYNKYFIEQMLTAAEQSGADCVYCKLCRNLEAVKKVSPTENRFAVETQSEAMSNLLFKMPQYGFYCYLYRKDLLLSNNLRFDEGTRYFEDREFNWKYLALCDSFARIDLELYGYRISANSATQKKRSWEHSQSSLNAVKRVEIFLEERKCSYAGVVKDYLFARVLWGMAQRAARSSDKEQFELLRSNYDVKACMKRTAKDSNKLVAISSVCYLIHPALFYKIVRLKK